MLQPSSPTTSSSSSSSRKLMALLLVQLLATLAVGSVATSTAPQKNSNPYAVRINKCCEKFEVMYDGKCTVADTINATRSHTPDVGFLNNVKRLNVALTRAKALLIVIGNSNTLQTDPNWYEFIKYCTTKEAIVGRCFGLDAKRIVERTNRDARFDALFNVLV